MQETLGEEGSRAREDEERLVKNRAADGAAEERRRAVLLGGGLGRPMMDGLDLKR
ncbi:hypothetical protein Syun_016583 [Stephania yunnanensis]|uniref:Uncharacterized protein n=1 Tax=Stephania yunnanensis TaxID=152371 RepID=A0AAP0J7S1_9MAGN